MLRYLTQPRWIPWHLFCVAALAGCLWMAGWQWHVATAPPPAGVEVSVWRNYAYAVNWLIFAVVGVWFWWRLPRDQMRAEAAEEAGEGQESEQDGVEVSSSALQHDGFVRRHRSGPPDTSSSVPAIVSPGPDSADNVASDGEAATPTTPVTRQQRFDPFA